MIVRLADPLNDAGEILNGAKDFVSRMDFIGPMPQDDAGLIAAMTRLYELPGFEIAVAEHDERIVGGIGMIYAPFVWNPGLVTASEMFWWTAPGAPRTAALALLRWVEKRMVEKGARLKEFVKLTSSPAGVTRVYERMGLRKVQESWMGSI